MEPSISTAILLASVPAIVLSAACFVIFLADLFIFQAIRNSKKAEV